MKKETISNDCRNCAYFVKHYANWRGRYYEVVGCQHCINRELTPRERKQRMNDLVPCEHWQPMEIQVQKRKEYIQETLLHVCNLLQEIADILQKDAESNK